MLPRCSALRTGPDGVVQSLTGERASLPAQDFCVNEPMAIFYGAMKGSFLAGALGVIIEEWVRCQCSRSLLVRSWLAV